VYISQRLGGPGAWAAVVVAFGLGSVAGDLTLLRVRPSRALRAYLSSSALMPVGTAVAGPLAIVLGTRRCSV
jgi:hypothetical protein